MNWTSSPIEELIETLKTCELDVPEGLPEEIVRRSEETLESLCDLLCGRELDAIEDRGESWWAPIHALHLLGAIGDVRAVPALIEVIRIDQEQDSEFLGDWLTEEMATMIAHMPPEGIEPFKVVVLDTSMDLFHRYEPAYGLFGIACRHPEYRQQVADLFIQLVREDEDFEFVSFLLGLLPKTNHPEAQAVFNEAFEKNKVDTFVIDQGDFERIQTQEGLWQDAGLSRDPMEYFSAKNLARLKEVQASWEGIDISPEEDFEIPDEHPIPWSEDPVSHSPRQVVKIGRNEPCPCGSGKKYKKCCLGTPNDPANKQ